MVLLLLILSIAALSIVYWTLLLGISPMPTSRTICQALAKELPKNYTGKIYDLGSGFGNMLFFFAHRYPNATIIGYEKSLVPYLISKVLLGRHKNVHIEYRDFLSTPYEKGWYYLYLFSKGTRKLDITRFRGCFVISNTFQLSTPYTKQIKVNDCYLSPIYLYHFDC
jgi:16S rRNA A1518/A1519 N6-dimethyltransferase RsmA/KsgA/DIM1 with predicted DNA glycosylase/AP lyase activity